MKAKFVVLGVVVVALIAAAIYLWGPGTVPAGQQPLTSLSSADASQFAAAFNSDADSTRLVLLLAPT